MSEKLLAVCPRQIESAHVGDPEARHHGGKGGGVLFCELAFHQGVLGPIHQLRRNRPQIPILDDWDLTWVKESPAERRRLQMSTRWFNNVAETRQ